MTKILFTNTALVQASPAAAHAVLDDPRQLVKWVPEVSMVTQDDATFTVERQQSALNNREQIAVQTTSDTVSYFSTGGRLEYELRFTMQMLGERMQLQETLLIDERASSHLPLPLLAPIAKHAFAENLARLVQVIAETQA